MPSRNDPGPSRNDPGSVCVFGDSHMASVKQAWDQGLIDAGGRAMSFWGADGPSFRALRWKGGKVVPDAPVRGLVRRISGGPETLAPEDHDLFIFYGARLRVHEFFAGIVNHERGEAGFLSAAARARLVARWTSSTRAWRIAREFSRRGARVVFVPTSLPTQGVLPAAAERQQLALKTTRAERARLWQMLEDEARANGFTLIPQPEETVTRSTTLTRAEYAVPGAREARDWVHKSPQFAALMVRAALAAAA